MLNAGDWTPNQPNTILFVLVDSNGVEVPGLGGTFTLQISKAGAAFAVSSCVKSEVGLGWYKAVIPAIECDTPGPVAIVVTGAGVIQQGLEYVVESRVVNAVEFTYTVTSTAGGNPPIEGVNVSIYTDGGATNWVFTGVTDSFGVLRDSEGNLPRLQSGTYFLIRWRDGFSFSNPDEETISP